MLSFSQLSVFEKHMQFNQKTDIHPITINEEIGLSLVFIAGKNIDVVYLDADHKFQREISLKRSSSTTKQYIGGYIVDSTLVLSFTDKK